MAESEHRRRYIENKKMSLLVSNLASNMPGTVVNSIIVSIILWDVVPVKRILLWSSSNILFVFIRYLGLFIYRKKFRFEHIRLWQRMLFVSFLISGLLFGSSLVFLVDPSRPEYIMFLYFLAGGMVAGGLGAYHNNLPVFFCYSSSVFLVPTVVLYSFNTPVTTSMAFLGIVFYLLCAVNARKMNTDLSDSLALRYDNHQLVKKLNMEKKNTEILNVRLMEKNHELRSLTRIDPLTGLKNRRYLFEEFSPDNTRHMEKRWLDMQGKEKRFKSIRYGCGIFMMDIDKFKNVNDELGHDSGDMVLKQFGARLMEKVRDDDVVARIGGEEFIIVLRDTDEKYIGAFAETVRSYISDNPFYIAQGREINITTSIGFAFFPVFSNFPVAVSFEQIISLADRALYRAKQNGRNLSVRVLCSESESEDSQVVEQIVSDIQGAVDREVFRFEICSG